jgi:hypothetical protein
MYRLARYSVQVVELYWRADPFRQGGNMFFELRQYRIFPGKRDEWVKFMEERIMPGQLAQGVVIVGSFVG